MTGLRWLVSIAIVGLTATTGPAVPRRTESPKNNRYVELGDIEEILDETDALPLLLISSKAQLTPLTANRLPRFSRDVMAKYRPKHSSLAALKKAMADNPDRYVLIRAVLQAVKALQKHSLPLGDTLASQTKAVTPQLKAKLLKDQRQLALAMHALSEALEVLQKAGKQRDLEPSSRWQADFDFIRGRMMLRLAHLHELNFTLGMVRREMLPELTKGQSRWRLISVSNVHTTERECRQLEADGNHILKKLLLDHPDTPWAFLARRDLDTFIGLEWMPIQ
jgi:hypothetical protein